MVTHLLKSVGWFQWAPLWPICWQYSPVSSAARVGPQTALL